jgi:hypothetical protein
MALVEMSRASVEPYKRKGGDQKRVPSLVDG